MINSMLEKKLLPIVDIVASYSEHTISDIELAAIARKIRGLNKIELVTLLTCSNELCSEKWAYNSDNQYLLERLVLLAVDKYI
jgi:hypothetical protein